MTAISEITGRLNKRFGFGKIPDCPKPGIFHYLQVKDSVRTRVHLRIDHDGSGLLLVNAQKVFHLNATAAFMAYLILEKTTIQAAIQAIKREFHVPASLAKRDYQTFQTQISQLSHPEGPCPVCDMELDQLLPFSVRPTAPIRMDLALTYRCNNDCAHCYNAQPRQRRELSTSDWHAILEILWKTGIPHVVFTGGEPTLRKDLPELISHAQSLGMITGLNTNGRRLADRTYVAMLEGAGLEHVQITCESHEPSIHDRMVNHQGAWLQTISGIKNAVASNLFVMTNTTLLEVNGKPELLSNTLDFLASLKVPTVGFNALIYSGRGLEVKNGIQESELPNLLEIARQKTTQYQQKLIWYTPTQYCHFDPMQMDLGIKGCTAALYNMCIEPDGSVLPCQSYYSPVGNILSEPWENIWNHDLAVNLRERRFIADSCRECELLQVCGGGCPLAHQAGQMAEPQPVLSFL